MFQDSYILHQQQRTLNNRQCPRPRASPAPAPPLDSKYHSTKDSAGAKPKLVENPFFDSDASSSGSEDDDDGIILLPQEDKKPNITEVIEIDSSSDHSPLVIPEEDDNKEEDEDHQEEDSIQMVEEVQTLTRKNSKKAINESLTKKRKKTDQYKEDFGSDFEDNFCSNSEDSSGDSSDEGVEDDKSPGSGLTLNLTSSGSDRNKTGSIETILGCSLSRLRR